MIKLLFLDIDGVLNTGESMRRGESIDLQKCRMINELCINTGALVILSSTWRIDWPKNLHFLRNAGITKLIGRTGDRISGDAFERGHQIQDVIDEMCPDRFAIIDDDDDMLPRQRKFFVQTEFDIGLRPAHALKLQNILGTIEED